MDINEIFSKQLNIQKLLNSDIITTKDRNTTYREHCLHTIEEIIEGLREINHKPWKQSIDIDNIDNLKDEIIDEFRFLINRCLLMDMNGVEFSNRFNKSLLKTQKRIASNY